MGILLTLTAETKQTIHKFIVQQRRLSRPPASDGEALLFEDDIHTKRGVKEAMSIKMEQPSIKIGGGLRHHLSATYCAILTSLLWQFNNHSHFDS